MCQRTRLGRLTEEKEFCAIDLLIQNWKELLTIIVPKMGSYITICTLGYLLIFSLYTCLTKNVSTYKSIQVGIAFTKCDNSNSFIMWAYVLRKLGLVIHFFQFFLCLSKSYICRSMFKPLNLFADGFLRWFLSRNFTWRGD